MIIGGAKSWTPRRAVNIDLDPKAMEALGVIADQVAATMRAENQDQPVDTLKTADRERVVQMLSRLQNPQDINAIIVARRSGSAVRLDQAAQAGVGCSSARHHDNRQWLRRGRSLK